MALLSRHGRQANAGARALANALFLQPSSGRTVGRIARFLHLHSRGREASRAFLEALQLEPGSAETLTAYASFLLLAQDGRGAAEMTARAAALLPGAREEERAEISPRLRALQEALRERRREGEEAAGGRGREREKEEVKRALKAAPGEERRQTDFALFLLRSGEVAKAESLFRIAVRTEPRSLHALLGLGTTFAAQSLPLKAQAMFLRALALHPRQPAVHRELGALHLTLHNYDEAETHLWEALELDHLDHRTLQLYGSVLALHKKLLFDKFFPDGARHFLGVVLDFDPQHIDAKYGLARIEESKLWNHASCSIPTSTAEKMYREVLEMEPGYASAHAGLGDLETLNAIRLSVTENQQGVQKVEVGQEFKEIAQEARGHYAHALYYEPRCYRAFKGLCRLEDLLGNSSNAHRIAVRALALDPTDPEPASYVCSYLKERNQFEEAEKATVRALKLNPNRADLLKLYGDLLWERDERRGALAVWKESYSEIQDSDFLHSFAMRCIPFQEVLVEKDTISRAFQLAVRWAPSNEEASHIFLDFAKYEAYVELDKELAERIYVAACSLNPDSARCWSEMAKLFYKFEDFHNATILYKQAAALEPSNLELQRMWALAAEDALLLEFSLNLDTGNFDHDEYAQIPPTPGGTEARPLSDLIKEERRVTGLCGGSQEFVDRALAIHEIYVGMLREVPRAAANHSLVAQFAAFLFRICGDAKRGSAGLQFAFQLSPQEEEAERPGDEVAGQGWEEAGEEAGQLAGEEAGQLEYLAACLLLATCTSSLSEDFTSPQIDHVFTSDHKPQLRREDQTELRKSDKIEILEVVEAGVLAVLSAARRWRSGSDLGSPLPFPLRLLRLAARLHAVSPLPDIGAAERLLLSGFTLRPWDDKLIAELELLHAHLPEGDSSFMSLFHQNFEFFQSELRRGLAADEYHKLPTGRHREKGGGKTTPQATDRADGQEAVSASDSEDSAVLVEASDELLLRDSVQQERRSRDQASRSRAHASRSRGKASGSRDEASAPASIQDLLLKIQNQLQVAMDSENRAHSLNPRTRPTAPPRVQPKAPAGQSASRKIAASTPRARPKTPIPRGFWTRFDEEFAYEARSSGMWKQQALIEQYIERFPFHPEEEEPFLDNHTLVFRKFKGDEVVEPVFVEVRTGLRLRGVDVGRLRLAGHALEVVDHEAAELARIQRMKEEPPRIIQTAQGFNLTEAEFYDYEPWRETPEDKAWLARFPDIGEICRDLDSRGNLTDEAVLDELVKYFPNHTMDVFKHDFYNNITLRDKLFYNGSRIPAPPGYIHLAPRDWGEDYTGRLDNLKRWDEADRRAGHIWNEKMEWLNHDVEALERVFAPNGLKLEVPKFDLPDDGPRPKARPRPSKPKAEELELEPEDSGSGAKEVGAEEQGSEEVGAEGLGAEGLGGSEEEPQGSEEELGASEELEPSEEQPQALEEQLETSEELEDSEELGGSKGLGAPEQEPQAPEQELEASEQLESAEELAASPGFGSSEKDPQGLGEELEASEELEDSEELGGSEEEARAPEEELETSEELQTSEELDA